MLTEHKLQYNNLAQILLSNKILFYNTEFKLLMLVKL